MSHNTFVTIGSQGFVRLVDTMPMAESNTMDSAIVQAARISYGSDVKDADKDKSLIRYLMRNRHTSPFEMVELKFHLKMPMFVARQWMRHRMASINEYSGRYSEIKDEFCNFKPYDMRMQSEVNKQSSDPIKEVSVPATSFCEKAEALAEKAYAAYTDAVDAGLAREQARTILPLSTYTQFYWKIDLHNFFHFVKLRAERHAQLEIQEFAQACYDLVRPLCPVACEAFEDYVQEAMHLSRQEVVMLKKIISRVGDSSGQNDILAGLGKTERLQFKEKLNRLGVRAD
jgi:thymidylate synthase (FAD)